MSVEVAHFSFLFDTVTAPVAPDTAMPEPATMEVTPAFVNDPLTSESPAPSKLLKDEPLTIRLVVLAVVNDE